MRGDRPITLVWCAAAALLALCGTGAARAELEAEDLEIRVLMAEQQPEMEKLLAEWVGKNTGTWNTTGLEAFAPLLAEPLKALGFEVTIEPGVALDYPDRKDARSGPLVVAERKAEITPESAHHFLLVGHFDTVFEADSAFQTFQVDPNSPRRAVGPGVTDMKGGLVVMLYALRALGESGDLARADFTVLLNSDEEIGSLGSRPRIEAEARRAQVGLVFEPAREAGEMARSRSGAGQFFLEVDGVAAHASSQQEGKSAIVALARKVIAVEQLTDVDRGILLNVGTISGGTKRNIVPAHASGWIDLRYDETAQGEEARAALDRIARADDVPGTSTRLWGVLHRPPKPATPQTDALLELHRSIVRELRFAVGESVHSAGVTDGSLTAAAGLPTLDSMGVRGGAAHTEREFIELPSLSERAAIAAVMLRRMVRAPRALPGLPAGGAKLESESPSPPVIAGSRPVVGP